jgi:hypothetical protein
MKDSETNVLEASVRARQYGITHADSFVPGSAAAELFTLLGDIIDEISGLSAAQAQADRAYREQVAQKNDFHKQLRADVRILARTTRAMERAMPNLHEKFRLPDGSGDRDWIAVARGFAADAVPHRDEFVRHGLPATFFNDFPDRIPSVEQAMESVAQKFAARVNATNALSEAVRRARKVLNDLNPVVRNVMAGDEAALAEWESASHVERPARRKKEDGTNTNTPPANG